MPKSSDFTFGYFAISGSGSDAVIYEDVIDILSDREKADFHFAFGSIEYEDARFDYRPPNTQVLA